MTKVFYSEKQEVFEQALARIGEVSPDVAEYEEAAQNAAAERDNQRRRTNRRPRV